MWSNKVDSVLASYVPIRNEKGQVIGALVVGIQLGDELSRVADATTGRPLVLAATDKDSVQVLARSTADTSTLDSAVDEGNQRSRRDGDGARRPRQRPRRRRAAGDTIVGAAPLESLGDGKSKVIVASEPALLIPDAGSLAMPALYVTALGIILVFIGGWLLGSYIMAPIARLEEGLLAIINGQTDKRFQLEHAELGGLAFRIDQLLNQLLGVEEDTTDEEGRISRVPTASAMEQAMGAGESSQPNLDPSEAAALASEPARAVLRAHLPGIHRREEGFGRADGPHHRTGLPEPNPVDGEPSRQQKGKNVRFKVQSNGREVVLLPVPI